MPHRIVDRALQLSLDNLTKDIDAKHRQIAEQFAQNQDDTTLAETHLSLQDYLSAVKLVLDETFDHEVWVRAEIRAVNQKGGHYYFELAEKNDAGEIVASCRATLWRFKAMQVLGKFSRTTGRELQAGISVLIRCRATFHAQYGFSINISDIDPNYTLGELAAAYHAMKKRLADEGLLHLNKKHPTPFDIRHVIVIAPEQAAGLGDFRAEADRLAKTGACHFHYHHATFQGNHAPLEIRTAILDSLDKFNDEHHTLPDLMVIIRGGGAVGDLAYLNDFELAAVVAECIVPVWVGVGHERDTVILDEVAHTSFDTPSKVVLGIQSHLVNMIQNAIKTMEQIHRLAHKQIEFGKQNTAQAWQQLTQTVKYRSQHERQKTISQLQKIKQATQHHLILAKQSSQRELARHQIVFGKLQHLRQDCRHLQSQILLQHPQRTLQKGYALIQADDGKMIGNAKQLSEQHTVSIKMHDGMTTAKILAADGE